MTNYRAICCALSLLITASMPVSAAEKRPAKKPAGRSETLACRLGTEDRHARIAVVVVRGKTDSFAYYSKWKPRTCSIYLQRNRDSYSKWADSGDITTVNLEKGAFLIEHKPGEYHFIFRDIDRERYCGMDGVINGSLTIKRGNDQCGLDGEIMVEGTPLGEAYAKQDLGTPPPTAGASDIASASAPAAASASKAPQQSAARDSAETGAPGGAADKSAAVADKPAAVADQPAAASEKSAAASAETKPDETGATRSAEAEKAATPSSGNPFSAFFRVLRRSPEEQAQ